MHNLIENLQPIPNQQLSDHEEGKKLFDQMSISDENPFENIQLSSEIKHSLKGNPEEKQDHSQELQDFRQMMKKSKKEKKKLKKKIKTKVAKNRQDIKKQNIDLNLSQTYKKPSKKMALDSDEQDNQQVIPIQNIKQSIKKKSKKKQFSQDNQSSNEENSAEYSSESNISESEKEKSANQEENREGDQENNDRKFKKRLGRKSRKQRILQRQGFDLKQLGNEGDANYELNSSVKDSDDSFSETGKKKKGNKKTKIDKKEKKPKLTNEEFLDKLKQIGCEDQIDQNESERYNYDSGFEELKKLRPKKESKTIIKVQNKLFGNLEMQIEQKIEEQQNNQNPVQYPVQVPSQKLQLQFIPKSTSTSRAGSFLNKVQAMKKHRGIEADIDHVQYEKLAKEKAKRSISQLMSKIQNEIEDNQEIDIDIKAPNIAKGKSADLINNTMFIVKSYSQKPLTNTSQNPQITENTNQITSQNIISDKTNELKASEKQLSKNTSGNYNLMNKKKPVSRSQFFKQFKESINVRRSKYVSAEELKNSLKPSKLEELEDIRKKIEEKRRKQAMYELGEVDDDDADNVINQLEDQVARQGCMSKDELRKLLRAEEGLEELVEYQEEKENKKKRQQDEDEKVPEEINQQALVNLSTNQNQHQISKSVNKQINEKKSKSEKLINGQNQKHADDMLQEYEGQEEDYNEEMDIEVDDSNNQNNTDQEQREGENQDEDENEEQKSEKQQSEKQSQLQENKNNQIVDQKHEIENQKLRKQLQDEGIIMPGANIRRKNPIQEQQINLNKYILQQNQNPLSKIITNTEPPKQQNTNENSGSNQYALQFKQFKKLRKIAVVIQQKKKKRQEQLKRAKQYFEQQAELGSDNQENDDNVKAINKKDDSEEEDGQDLDQELQELIDNAVDINEENQQEAFKKYMEYERQKDREQLQRILRGDFRRRKQDMPEMNEMEEDEKNRVERIQKMVEWMKKRQDDENNMYAKEDSEEDDQMNYYYDYNGNKKKAEDRKRKTYQDEENNEQTPEQNDQEIEKKLQYYLMDTISPAKRDDDIPVTNDLFVGLSDMFKKGSRSLNAPFGKKNIDFSISQVHKIEVQKSGTKPSSNIFNFAGNIFNLAGNKGDKNILPIPKTKKTASHMSEFLNKNKTHKPALMNVSSNKLSSIFSRGSKK